MGCRGIYKHIAACGVVYLALVSLSGCVVDIAPPGAFRKVNAVAIELDLASIGDVVKEARYGSYGSDRPTYVAIVTGDDVSTGLAEELRDEGFESNGLFEGRESWDRGEGTDDYVTVTVRVVNDGDNAGLGDGRSEKVEAPGVALYISG